MKYPVFRYNIVNYIYLKVQVKYYEDWGVFKGKRAHF